MAKLIINDEEFEIPDGEAIAELCEQAGVPFNCQSGVCGTCQIKVLEGEENLSELTQEEMDLGMDHYSRLACQCTIKRGIVKITF